MQKKIKILHIQETIGSGGVERRRLSLAKHLSKDLFVQKFVCTKVNGTFADEIRAEGHEVIVIGLLKSLLEWSQHKKIQRIIEDYQPDIVHGAVFEGVTLATINGYLKRVPSIVIEETSDPLNRSWRGNLLMKFFAVFAHKVVGVSEGVTEEYLKDKLHIPAKKVVLINNGVAMPRDVSALEISEAKLEWGISKDDFVIGSIGRMQDDEHKRFSDLIKGFALFAKHKSDVKLVLIGEGVEKEGYIKLVKELQIEKNVIFTGYQTDVTLFYKMMDVFSLVSAREAFGLVLAEAMLNKLPIVATKVGGMKYIVDDDNTGFLVERFSSNSIGEKFEILYQDKDLRKQLGISGFEKALCEYTEAVYIKKVEQLYENLFFNR